MDDSATNREIVSRQAKAWGMHVDALEAPSDALARIRGDRFDVAVIDMQMPGMDGLALAREIRRSHDRLAADPAHLARPRGGGGLRDRSSRRS